MVVFVVGFQRKREDILSSSIQTRSKAHGIIKRMLASLGDPYTRFLSPAEVIASFVTLFFDLLSNNVLNCQSDRLFSFSLHAM